MNTSEQFQVSDKRKAVWNIELQILDELVRICEKYNIKYFLAGGSMLGAARHNGFIPWDDDIDVGMLRPDYNRFLEICKEELPQNCFLQTFDSDEQYCYIQAKIRRSDTTAIRMIDWKSGLTFNQGIFVDIVPFDNIPDRFIPRVWHYVGVVFFERILKRHYNYRGFGRHTLRGRIFKMMVDCIFAVKSPDKIYACCNKMLSKYSGKKTKYIGEIVTLYRYKKSRRERVLYDELVDHQFEDRIYKIPKRYDEILSLAYGDWRTPKPQAPSLHGTTFIDPYHPYTEYLEGKRTLDFDSQL